MASAARLPLKRIATVGIIALTIGAWKSRPLVVGFFTGPGSYSRILALAVVLANYKNFPGVWHIRVWKAILQHMLLGLPFTPTRAGLTDATHLPALFQPTITRSFVPVSECDYNLHKSNSTYFSDLDTSRSHLVCALMHTAIEKLQKNPGLVIGPDGKPAKGRYAIMLGGVHCSFKREIKPYEEYEMWTRLLCWDRKWLYVVTHFVKKGTVKPDGWTLDDPRDAGFLPKFLRRARKAKVGETAETKAVPKIPENVIFASAISKYVMKLGRLTIHPEASLYYSGLLPPKPGGWNIMDKAPTGDEKAEEEAEAKVEVEGLHEIMEGSILSTLGIPNGKENSVANKAANGSANGGANGSARALPEAATGWDWKMIEAENAKGMQFAAHHHTLDDLIQTFTGNTQPALGYYTDLL